MLVIGLAVGIFLYFLVLGWGLATFALPRALKQYHFWLAPWLGIMLAAVLGVESSRLGLKAAIAVYPITMVAAGLSTWSFLRRPQARSAPSNLSWAFAIGSLVTLFLALYSLLSLDQGPTTLSLGNGDPVVYAVAARFLEHGSLRHLPVCEVRQPIACMIRDNLLALDDRPGTYWLIGALSHLFRLQTFEMFTVLLAVVLAVTPPLAAIFAWAVSANRFAALLTVVIAAVNVNLLYFFYHGFAGQVLGQGCLMVAFLLWWKSEASDPNGLSYVPLLGLTIAALLEIYQEDVPLFAIPYVVYAGMALLTSKTERLRRAYRFALPGAIAFALDPVAFWGCFGTLWNLRAVGGGWPMPRWALPADMVGLVSVYLPRVGERAALVASIPVVLLTGWGFSRWRKPRLTLVVTSFVAILLAYAWRVRDFSYGYHKLAAILSLLLVAAFATGIAQSARLVTNVVLRKYVRIAALVFISVICLVATVPLVEDMREHPLLVGSDLAQLSEVKRITGSHPIFLDENRWWQQMWAAYFLYPVPTLIASPSGYFHLRTGASGSSDSFRLVLRGNPASATGYFGLPSDDRALSADQLTLVTATTERSLWSNADYSLLGSSDQEHTVPLLRLIGEQPDGWITSRGLILDIPGDWVRDRPNLKLSGPASYLKRPGPSPIVRAILNVPNHSPQEVGATFESTADRYTILVRLNPSQLPDGKYFQLRIKVDQVAQSESNPESRRHVIMGPQEISLLKSDR